MHCCHLFRTLNRAGVLVAFGGLDEPQRARPLSLWRRLWRAGFSWRWLAWVAAFLGALSIPAADPAPSVGTAKLPLLTEVRQVLSLSPIEAARHYPVRVRGVVTLFNQGAGLCFVQDATAGIYVYFSAAVPALKDSQIIEVEGASEAGMFSPVIAATNVTGIGEGKKPAARRVSSEQFSSGSVDGQWVEIEGVVRAEKEEWITWVLDLATEGYRFQTRIFDFPRPEPARLFSAKVRIQGVAAASHNNRRQLTGFHLLVPSMTNVTVVEPSASDPYSTPLQLARSLFAFSTLDPSRRSIRVRGVVTLQWPGQALFIKDQSGGLMIKSPQATPVQPGDLLEAVGFPAHGEYSPVLEDALFRKLGVSPKPKATEINAAQAMSGDFDNELVQIEAKLLDKEDLASGQMTLMLQRGTNQFYAFLRKPEPHYKLSWAPTGSRLRLTGVCAVDADENRKPRGWNLWLRSPDDVEVRQRPAPWLMVRLIWVLGLLGAGTAAGLVWIATLRLKVRQETALLRQREAGLEARYRDLFENANDIIFTLDLEGHFTSLNRAGEMITGYSRDEALHVNLRRLALPSHQATILGLLERHQAGDARANCELEMGTKDGQSVVVELITRLDYAEGKVVGIQGIGRDITARKRAEEALCRSENLLRLSLQERQRISQDLHDDIIQSLYALGLGLENCRGQIRENPQAVEERLEQACHELNRIFRDMRSFILGLDSETLDGPGFQEALRSLVRILGNSTSGSLTLEVDPEAIHDLRPQQTMHLLHIAREAMSNSLRHAHASSTDVALRVSNGHIILKVKDNGDGFDVQAPSGSGHGLRNITARAHELGAQLTVQSQAGQGTRVVLELPKNQTNP